MRKTKFAIKALIICLLFTAGFQSILNTEPRAQKKSKSQPAVPIQLLPADNASFKGYPTTLTLEWKPVKEATSYDVEIDCSGCSKPGKWDSEIGKAWKIAPGIAKTRYTFIFAGNYRGRWRVRASKGFFQKGDWSSWRFFRFDTTGSKKTALEACGIVLESLSKTKGIEGESFVMHGVWSSSIGQKIPCLKNKNKIIQLPILIWSENIIRVKIPAEVPAGKYQVGVYCRNPRLGPSDSSGWLDFEIMKNSNE